MMKTKLFVFFFLIISSFTQAQNEHWWWYEIHQHDGVTPWQRYLVMSPAFFGPNAFPIPEIQNGKLSEQLSFETALELHLNTHEQTENIYTKLSIPLIKNKVALFLNLVPMEHYSYDTLIRDQRFSRNYEGKGFASGDLYIGTQIQLIENHAKWPDLLLGINLRTASGNDFESARFADSPGYFFDLSAGKSILFNEEGFIKSIRWYAVLGFYVWQTNFSDHMQDDALLYGAGLQFNTKHSSWANELGGFYGYLGNGDRPTVFRSRFKTRLTEKLQISSQFEHGLVDYNFRSFRISLIYIFKS
ncbi:MAG: hypothetical protein JW729_07875 [Bacteroidales bacterium]|nr:hypothetical protein [Bacteroidales bacterium]